MRPLFPAARLWFSLPAFLVIIDEIDRLDRSEIRSTMQTVKTVGKLPNVVYLLAYDRKIVWAALDDDVPH
jgi:predicted KAP-like P-loop ATPase